MAFKGQGAAVLPYLPPGAYYSGRGSHTETKLSPFMLSRFDRWTQPVEVFDGSIAGSELSAFFSSLGARVGPQPSWTDPMAIVRYVHYPNGFEFHKQGAPRWIQSRQWPRKLAANDTGASFLLGAVQWHHVADDEAATSDSTRARPEAATSTSTSQGRHEAASPTGTFEGSQQDPLELRDGDYIEVQQWGGWVTHHECPVSPPTFFLLLHDTSALPIEPNRALPCGPPGFHLSPCAKRIDSLQPICGMYGNLWRGTGLLMRVDHPFVSLNKGTAIVQMLMTLGARNATALADLARKIKVATLVKACLATHANATAAECFVSSIMRHAPCPASDHAHDVLAPAMDSWLAHAAQLPPQSLARELLSLGNARARGDAAKRFAVYWAYGICGIGSLRALTQRVVGWDGMVAALACILGHRTIIYSASSNDNGELPNRSQPKQTHWRPFSTS